MNDDEEPGLDDSGSEQGDCVAMLYEDSDSESEQGDDEMPMDLSGRRCRTDADCPEKHRCIGLPDYGVCYRIRSPTKEDFDEDLSEVECRTEPVGFSDQKKSL